MEKTPLSFEQMGIARKIDNSGCIVIPPEIRDRMGWKTGDTLYLFVTNQGVLIPKAELE